MKKDMNGESELAVANMDVLVVLVAQLSDSPHPKMVGSISFITQLGKCSKLVFQMFQKVVSANTNEAVGRSSKYADQWMGN